MRVLKSLGLTNPRIEVCEILHKPTGDKDKAIRFQCDNYTSTPRIGKIYSYFQKYFDDFLYKKTEEGLVNKFGRVLKEEDINQDSSENVLPQFIIYIEEEFEIYLEDTMSIWKSEIKVLSKSESFPKISWRKAKIYSYIQADKNDINNGWLVYCAIPKFIADKKNNIRHDKEIQVHVENIIYNSKHINCKQISVYCYVLSDVDLYRMSLAQPVKDMIQNGCYKITFFPTNKNTKQDYKKSIYLRKSLIADKGGVGMD